VRLPKILRRLRDLVLRHRRERELDDELRFHLEREAERNRALGMDATEAQRAALRRFGGVEATKEEARDVRGLRLVGELARDLGYGLRLMRKSPAFTAVAVLSLALGIGANTALFSVADALLMRTLPVKEPDRLVLLEWQAGIAFRNSGTTGWSFRTREVGRRGSSSFHQRIYEELRRARGALTDLVAFAGLRDASLVVDGQAEVLDGQYVSGNYFRVLGVPALLGRTLDEQDDRAGAAPAAVISHRFWQTRFGGDPGVVGKQVRLDTVGVTIVGVTPPDFTGTMQVDARPAFMVPLALEPLRRRLEARGHAEHRDEVRRDWWLHLLGRLAPGATIPQAQASLDEVFRALALQMMPPPRRDDEPARLEPRDHPQLVASAGGGGMLEARRGFSKTIYALFAGLGLVLIIACANVANMLLARSAARRAEIALRLATGAGRARLVRQLLTESLLLAALGGVLGVAFAFAGQRLLVWLAAGGGSVFPADVDYGLSWRTFAFTAGVALATALLFGLVPALRATRLDLGSVLKHSQRGPGAAAGSRLSKSLVVVQVAISLVLLVGAGLFLRTVRNLEGVALGFNPEGLLLFDLRPAGLGFEGARLKDFYAQLFRRLDGLPGVRSATFATVRLINHSGTTARVLLPGETARLAAQHEANRQVVRETYFATMEIPLVRGRGFTAGDSDGAPRVAVVNETLAREYFPGREALGQRIRFDRSSDGELEIVGVVRDTRYNRQRNQVQPLVYTCWRQAGAAIGWMSFALRTAGDPTALVPSVQRVVRELDPNLPVTAVTTQVEQSRKTIAAERFFALLLSGFGALAALLAAVGLYGVMAYGVAQRTGEIGIRMALGAQAAGVRRLIVRQGMTFAALGVAAGLLGARALEQVAASQLYGVTASDPVTFAAAAATLLAVALIACWIPARRATRVDPMIALRAE
jgi:predicted permease